MAQPCADERQRLLPRDVPYVFCTQESESNSHPVYNSTVINLGQTLHASAKPPRVVALDLLRGLIMVLQSIDRMWFFWCFGDTARVDLV
ncbi:hypothetical protein BC938DRAFT_476558 [Jimgerdemannia flammicorona]|uniref:Uncharacterized protein n=1 Tax=Jimgerdemannia flammicorona TaxID=994334 RepID=A0A433PG39_9FUNG|nr:hypothetical protein BC938DRAFT_476558 [Jimgerdemannia flammicorona]